MKLIPTTYRKNGWPYALIDRGPNWALYSQGKPDAPQAWELVQVRVRPASIVKMNGVEMAFEEHEALPSTEDWGQKAWTFHTLEAARHAIAEKTPSFGSRPKGKAIP